MSISSLSVKTRVNARTSMIVAVVVFAAMAALCLRFIPDAAAAEAETEEVGNFIFEISAADNILGVTNKSTRTRLEDNLDAVAAGATATDFNTLLTEVRSQFKADFGWDLTIEADRVRLQDEIHLLSQALFSIPDETFETAEFAPLRDLRDLAAGVEGTAECRDRCLPDDDAEVNRVISTFVGSSVRKMLNQVTGAGLTAQVAIYAVGLFVGGFTKFILDEGPARIGIGSNTLRALAIASGVGILEVAKEFRQEANEFAAGGQSMGEAAKEAAKEVAAATPTEAPNESADDYDLIKDEL